MASGAVWRTQTAAGDKPSSCFPSNVPSGCQTHTSRCLSSFSPTDHTPPGANPTFTNMTDQESHHAPGGAVSRAVSAAAGVSAGRERPGHRCAESAPPLPVCEPTGQGVHHQEAGARGGGGAEGGGVTASVLLKPLAAASGELTGSPGVNTCFQSDSPPRRDVGSKKQPRLRLQNSSGGTRRSPQPGQETHGGKHTVCPAKNLIYKCDGGAGGMWSMPPFQHRTF